MRKYGIITLGCSKNLVDSERFAFIIERSGYILTNNLETADLIFVNTCGFIEEAKKEAIDTIFEALEYKKIGVCKKVIVSGCFVQRYFKNIQKEIPEIDNLINLKDFNSFAKLFEVDSFKNERKLLSAPHYAYLRISDGCDSWCSYCTIPFIRGSMKSVPIELLLEETKKLVGVKELILTSQNSALYGRDIYGECALPKLLEALSQIDSIKWIRVLYLHPDNITNKIIETMHNLPKVCNYFEIPLQHISQKILTLMNRKRTKIDIENFIHKIRKKESVLRTTLISGFPTENREDFLELQKFIKSTEFNRLGVFTYSNQEGTKSFNLKPQVSKKVANSRKKNLMEIQNKISKKWLKTFVSKQLEIIIDYQVEKEKNKYVGRTRFDAPEIDGNVFVSGEVKVGEIYNCKIISSYEYDLEAIKL